MYSRQIETFVKVVECGSFSKAAEKLYISTVSVMKQVNAVEDRIGVKLLERTNKGIFLTEAGRSVYQDSKRIIQECEDAMVRARQVSGEELYTIRIGSSVQNPAKPLIDIWKTIQEKNPQYKIKIIPFEDNHESILDCISQLGNRFDFIVAACGSNKWLSLCNFYELKKCWKCVAVPHSHRLSRRSYLNIEDLYGENLMIVKRGDSPENNRLRDMLEREHPQINIIDTPYFYDMEVFNQAEECGYILSTLDIWADVHPSLVTIPVNWDFSIPYGIMSSKTPSKPAARFLQEIQRAITG